MDRKAFVPLLLAEEGKVVEKIFAVGNYRPAFLVAGIACVLAVGICFLSHPPAHAAPAPRA